MKNPLFGNSRGGPFSSGFWSFAPGNPWETPNPSGNSNMKTSGSHRFGGLGVRFQVFRCTNKDFGHFGGSALYSSLWGVFSAGF